MAPFSSTFILCPFRFSFALVLLAYITHPYPHFIFPITFTTQSLIQIVLRRIRDNLHMKLTTGSLHKPTNMMQECQADHEDSSKKRKLEDSQAVAAEISEKQHKTKSTSSPFDANLSLETPLPPSEWQRYLDIKSGQVYFYNTSTRKNSPSNPRFINQPELLNPCGMSLELDLNLPCGSRKNGNNDSCNELQSFGDLINNSSKDEKKNDSLRRSPSWLTFEADQKEMVTAVCKKCHMLVMMCKSSPACPNCKFLHPPDQNLLSLFTPKAKPLVLKSV